MTSSPDASSKQNLKDIQAGHTISLPKEKEERKEAIRAKIRDKIRSGGPPGHITAEVLRENSKGTLT